MAVRFVVILLCGLGLIGCDDGGAGAPTDGAIGAPDTGHAPDGALDPDAAVPDGAIASDLGALPDARGPDAGGPDACPSPCGPPPPPPAPVADCDPLVPQACSLPWPSSLYLVADDRRATGVTLSFGPTSLPANAAGEHIDPAPYRRMDGYGLGVPIMVILPNLDVTPIASELEIETSLDADAPVLLLEIDEVGATRRVPYWAELDFYEQDRATRTLLVHPAEILKEQTRYLVAFRGLRDLDGAPIAPSEAFAALRDGADSDDPAITSRAERFAEIFALLEAEGVDRATLNLAWDFTTASSDALHGRMLHMVEAGLAATEGRGAELTIDEIETFLPEDDGSGAPVHPFTALRIKGTMRVPLFMKEATLRDWRGYVFNLGDDGLPAQKGWREAPFWLNIPHSAVDGSGTPHGLVAYGHGLFGDGRDAVDIGWTRPIGRHMRPAGSFASRIANEHHLIYFACDLLGMSDPDRDTATSLLVLEPSHFTWMADALHQGLLEYVLLARGMRERLADLPEIRDRGIVIDPTQLYYSGRSQGGIFGASFMALTPDITYGHLGVPGANYATILHRSVDFASFFAIIQSIYDTPDQSILIAAFQLLWDGTDPISYYRHLSVDPFPGNDPHYVIAATAKGDYQVAPLSLEVVARSGVGMATMGPYDAERPPALVELAPYPHQGSALILWDFGNPWPAPGNHPPEDLDADPHEYPPHEDSHNAQMVHFFRTGEVIDVCGGQACPNP